MTAPKEIRELVGRFDLNIEEYKSGKYNETQLRREFLDPFFAALGWDVNNKQGLAEAYKDVIHEDSIKVGAGTKAPDYCFRVGGSRRFFVEAKKPSINLKEDISPAFQVRRYAWSAKLPLSILCDFEELSVYDCRVKPIKTDKASNARILYFTYKDYLDKWDEIAAIFSKAAVLQGSFDKFIGAGRKNKGTAEVDKAFLLEIESWRELLAKDLAANNSKLGQRELNFAVQRIIDRIIFLRICEDRGIEEYGRLMALLNGTRVYARLGEIFTRADEKYNSGLFHFKAEKDIVEAPDELTLKLKIRDKTLKQIIKNLYYPDSPYEFSVFSADILGRVYEQFLGKVIRLTAGHRAVVEEKPEVRKAGGIYYTPVYIVDYIVKNTVGKLVEGKTPKQVAALKILDPACGSGSFLIGAYQYLLDWHRDWYVKAGAKKRLYRDIHGEWKLTTAEKKQILLNNIFGVDIDNQAVEVTKLSLLLKVLEGETEQTINSTLRLFHERALPDLASNIKCGNSLIGPDFYDNRQGSLFDENERWRVNAFDWNREFSEIMNNGGFDAVIGNPPWGSKIPNTFADYMEDKFDIKTKNQNLFAVFVIASLFLLKKQGLFGMLIPKVFIKNTSYIQIRKQILKEFFVRQLIDFGKFPQIASDAICLIILNGKVIAGNNTVLRRYFDAKLIKEEFIDQSIYSQNPIFAFSFDIDISKQAVLMHCLKDSKRLNEICVIRRGIELGQKANLVRCKECHSFMEIGEKYYGASIKKCQCCGAPIDRTQRKICISNSRRGDMYDVECVSGREIDRYIKKSNYFILENLKGIDYKAEIFNTDRIFLRRISTKPAGMFISKKEAVLAFNTVYSLCKIEIYSPYYLLGILNSRLMGFYYEYTYNLGMALTTQITIEYLSQLPIRVVDFNDSEEKATHEQMAKLVEKMLGLHKQLPKAKLPQDKESIQRQIDATDKQIDQLVYQLYGLTDEEIKIVEEVE
ncbi:hypothetical protein A2291_01530 [candidate division WOR-1 bacterium RIFOXYB2_FULL_42_35]|uniref:site-specific DNA-methyltransferase (adenine-specific) n=1 Tax=candidate division WOR-1 bacterium RIFOXYC2_FULL_41_25 TaxID=1802586 RepID=A0A1F4TRZ7_UNCSA|nr:MAG: hypothetical protein A2247_03330 [candidate division WOR-1 bacterium RIFOXYA2_FULL_41_14]OGC25427.1 MAG: hypothetical protein A2291_01530 [candidate division WOR-1 bacterium RIFOXYB2_FULL_42_35]OGC34833.1 MAG: hypothetical protein A2462_05465 [candidate division WOR-1 bacterium RIFOXYC2_FULL_41_25]